jgi:hypothetical protein
MHGSSARISPSHSGFVPDNQVLTYGTGAFLGVPTPLQYYRGSPEMLVDLSANLVRCTVFGHAESMRRMTE